MAARMFSPRLVSDSNGTWRVLPQQRRARHIGQAKATGVSLKLVKIGGIWLTGGGIDKHTETRRQQSPDAAAVYSLQGKLFHGHGDITRAIEMYAESLKLNPFMWDAFLGLCELGRFF